MLRYYSQLVNVSATMFSICVSARAGFGQIIINAAERRRKVAS